MDWLKKKRLESLDEYMSAEVRCDDLWDTGESPELLHLVELMVLYEEENESQVSEIYGNETVYEDENIWDAFYPDDTYPFDQ